MTKAEEFEELKERERIIEDLEDYHGTGFVVTDELLEFIRKAGANEDYFYEHYTPEINQVLAKDLDAGMIPDCSWDGCFYETTGEEMEYVSNTIRQRVWTIIDTDGALCISAGFHRVNRLGYLITAEEWTDENEHYEVETVEEE